MEDVVGQPHPIQGRWIARALIEPTAEPTPLQTERPPTIEFADEGSIFVFTGCNRGRSTYALEEGAIRLGPMALTRMACPGEADRLEQAVLRVLAVDAPVSVSLDEDQLRLVSGQWGLVLERAGEST